MHNQYGQQAATVPAYLPLQPGVRPQVAFQPQVPQQVQPYIDMLLYFAVEAIQAEANLNQLRGMFFTTMAANQYANPAFAEFMTKLGELFLMQMTVQPSQPDQVGRNIASQYVQYRVCRQVQDHNLMYQMPAEVVNLALTGVQNFQNWAAQLENAFQNRMRQGSMGGGQMGGYGSPQTGYNPMASNPLAAGRIESTGQGMSNDTSGRYGTPTGDWRTQGRFQQAQQAQQAQQPQQQHAFGLGNIGNREHTQAWNGNASSGDWRTPPAAMPPPAPLPAVRVEAIANASGVIGVTPSTPSPYEVQARHEQAAQPVAQPATVEAPKAQIFIPPAYDPNLFDLLPRTESGQFGLKEKKMDRERHLGKPLLSPGWVRSLTVNESEARLEKAKAEDPIGEEISVERIGTGEVVPCTRLEEPWTRVQARADCADKKAKVSIFTVEALEFKGMPASDRAESFVNGLVGLNNLVVAGGRLADALANYTGRDLAYVVEVNARLTQRVNHFINHELGLDYGHMDNFAEDIGAQIDLLQRRLGSGTVKLYQQHADKILRQALSTITTADAEEALRETYYNTLTDEDFGQMRFLSTMVYCASVNLTSVELRLDLVPSVAASMLTEATAPLAYRVVDALMKYHDNHTQPVYLRTLDGVRLNICTGALNASAYMVSLFK